MLANGTNPDGWTLLDNPALRTASFPQNLHPQRPASKPSQAAFCIHPSSITATPRTTRRALPLARQTDRNAHLRLIDQPRRPSAMSASLKAVASRWPSSAQGLARCCPKAAAPASTTTASFSTAARPVCLARAPVRHHRQPAVMRSTQGLSVACTRAPRFSIVVSAARSFSSSAASSSTQAAAASASSSSSTSSANPSKLDWNSFFKLRLRRRRIQLIFSVGTGLLGGAGGAILLSTGMAEPLVMQIPLDPFVTLGLMTLACAGMGWLVGPSIGNQVFYLLNHRYKAQMIQKEVEFFARVKKNRVDPSNSSAGNPVPDFYGEKIQSVSGYRQWLKDQRAFNKKKTANFPSGDIPNEHLASVIRPAVLELPRRDLRVVADATHKVDRRAPCHRLVDLRHGLAAVEAADGHVDGAWDAAKAEVLGGPHVDEEEVGPLGARLDVLTRGDALLRREQRHWLRHAAKLHSADDSRNSSVSPGLSPQAKQSCRMPFMRTERKDGPSLPPPMALKMRSLCSRDEADRLEGLQDAHDSDDGAHDAALAAADDALGRRRAGEDAAVAGPAAGRAVEGDELARGLEGRRRDERTTEQHARVRHEVPRRRVVGAVENEVVLRDDGAGVARREVLLVAPVRHLDLVGIDEAQRADARAREVRRGGTAQAAGADDEDPALLEPQLGCERPRC
ncbi:LOW QUALITY PROTEIN: Presequence translocated-associated motor subunit pam17 [Purpureocillium lavendulum]|uniref:Presequence translocated-associated motor subunit PAM17, mitochondrial n=1 Tax=Purpureocillium lavendulum TaxID=1247861 RepID=A0AB34G104_9HYPO|nr:LOW QUALITY PROTEIN: Presequence translocated-associated motor subunit pam17 [Purpureocillium lavendulum]